MIDNPKHIMLIATIYEWFKKLIKGPKLQRNKMQ